MAYQGVIRGFFFHAVQQGEKKPKKYGIHNNKKRWGVVIIVCLGEIC